LSAFCSKTSVAPKSDSRHSLLDVDSSSEDGLQHSVEFDFASFLGVVAMILILKALASVSRAV